MGRRKTKPTWLCRKDHVPEVNHCKTCPDRWAVIGEGLHVFLGMEEKVEYLNCQQLYWGSPNGK
jgi:hypothetical protein